MAVRIQSLDHPTLVSDNVATLGVPQPTPILVGGRTDGTAVVYNPANGQFGVGNTLPFFPGFAGEVRTATADVTGDGVQDFIGGTGVGRSVEVAVIDCMTQQVIARFQPFESTYDGAKLAKGLANGQPFGQPAQLDRFFGVEGDSNFRGGARPALADMNGDQTPDLIVSAGFLCGPRMPYPTGPHWPPATPPRGTCSPTSSPSNQPSGTGRLRGGVRLTRRQTRRPLRQGGPRRRFR